MAAVYTPKDFELGRIMAELAELAGKSMSAGTNPGRDGGAGGTGSGGVNRAETGDPSVSTQRPTRPDAHPDPGRS